jgi:NADH-quinone oxidoreductase subunit N
MWAPDVYDGAPTPVTAYMATGVKAAAFLALARVLMVGFPLGVDVWQPLVGALAVLSMVVGNLIALSQRSLKRMLAYSSIAHAGYLLAAVWTGSHAGAGATLMYLLAYVLTSLVAFGILAVLGRGGEREVTIESIGGLGRRHPWLAFGLSVSMFSLLGFPGTFGFIGQWAILQAIVAEHHQFLAVVLVVTSLVSAGYYLPVVRAIYMRDPETEDSHVGAVLPPAARIVVAVSVLAILIFGLMPQPLVDESNRTARSFIGSNLDRMADQR